MSDIKKGDLVMVVRWNHSCVNPRIPIGKPFIVTDIVHTEGRCGECGELVNPGRISARGAYRNVAMPLPWLKKIDPPAAPETVEHDQEITA